MQDAVRAGFDGIYSYFASDRFSFASTLANWPSIQTFAAANHLLWVPSVGPGYSDLRVRPWNRANVKARVARGKVASPATLALALDTYTIADGKAPAYPVSASATALPASALALDAGEKATEGADAGRASAMHREWSSTSTAPLYYDAMWAAAAKCGSPVVSITSFNEWHEGTQLELVEGDATASASAAEPSFLNADGSVASWQPERYLTYGSLAPSFYLQRTAHWLTRLQQIGAVPADEPAIQAAVASLAPAHDDH